MSRRENDRREGGAIFHLIQNKQNKKWECAFVSEEYHKLTGISRRRIDRFLRSMDEVYDLPKEMGKIAAAIRQAAESPKNVVIDNVLTGSDGQLRDIRCDMYSVVDEDGTMHIYGHLMDMTEQNKKQKQLHIREEEGKAVLVQSGRMIYRYLIDGRRAILTDNIAALFEIPKEIDNWPQWAVDRGRIQPESAAGWLRMFDAIDRGEKSGAVEVRFCKGADIDRRYRMQFTGIADSVGIPVSAIISIEDVTSEYERNRLQGLETEGLLRAVREMFPEVIILNLRSNEYRIMQYEGYTTRGTAKDGIIDDMINIRVPAVAEEDRELFLNTFSVSKLREAFIEQGKDRISAVYRRLDNEGNAFWFETTVIRMENPYDNDVLAVAVSRNMDEQKAEEERLRQELRMQSEELRLTMGQVGKKIVYYDIQTSVLTFPPATAVQFGLPEKIENFPECIIDGYEHGQYAPESVKTLKQFYQAIRRGDSIGTCELRLVEKDGTERWEELEFATIRDEKGRPRKAVISAEDITERHAQGVENVRLREQELLLRSIAGHSDRVVCYYDIHKGRSEHWSEENCAKCILPKLCQQPLEEMLKDPKLMPESVQTVKTMFDDIHRGVVEDGCRMHVMDDDGESHWLDMKYSTRFDAEHKPFAVMFSYADITEQYEREVAYQHYSVLVKDDAKALLVMEMDLTDDNIVRKGGTLPDSGMIAKEGITHEDFREIIRRTSVTDEGFEEAGRFFSREYLLMQFTDGNHHLEAEWQMHASGGELRWVRCIVDMVRDPYALNIKGFCRAVDITEEKEAQFKVQNRAERDAMTGLLNRGTCEERIRQVIEEGADIRGGVLLVLDLDDLKGINDIYGHEQGDHAIRSIADTLKTHFREGDVIGRIGGDEFMVFLRKAAGREDAIGLSISSLFRKLALICIGDNGERSIQCSIGCATEIIGKDSFESMYKRADLALYHVKRSGKNSFAFYSADMEQADYSFRQNAISLKNAKNFEWSELQHLMAAISTFYPMILSVNLSANTYYMMEVARENLAALYQPVGRFDDFVNTSMEIVHPDDRQFVQENLSREALIAAYENGKSSVVHSFRYKQPETGYIWVKYIYIFHLNDDDELCCFGMTRWAREREQEMEMLRMQKILELAVTSVFEYLCLIDTKEGRYSMYGNDGKNTHTIPKTGIFDDVTREIRDNYIAPDERKTYYNDAHIERITARMKEQGEYSYTYEMPDGKREAAFYWYEPTHTELLMTVRKL